MDEKKVAIPSESIPVVIKEHNKIVASRTSLVDSKTNAISIAPLSTMEIEEITEKVNLKTQQIVVLKALIEDLEEEKKELQTLLKQ